MEVDQQNEPIKEEHLGEEMMDATNEEDEMEEELPKDASETIYIKNLEERVKIENLKETLGNLFSLYGKILSITIHKNVRMRGQAFICFDSKLPAYKAIKEVKGFPLYGKPIQLAFARTDSDAIVKKRIFSSVNDESTKESILKKHKNQRIEHKKRQRIQWRRRQLALRAGENEGQNASTGGIPGMESTVGRRQEAQLPDEYLPPNRILFIHNVPQDVDKDSLDSLFRPFVGLMDVRHIPARGVAFVEFGDAMQSSSARDALNGHLFTPQSEKLRITFAK